MNSKPAYDFCIIGSGAGGGPVAYELSRAGFSVVVLEKGPWFRTKDLTKDEIVATRRSVYTPSLLEEPQVLENQNDEGGWDAVPTYESGRDFWNGNCVGGSSNFMSGYFHRLKPNDFRLLSTYGEIEGANVVDWPISYDEMEAWYTKVETVVGVSGKVVPHSTLEPRSTKDFPFPPLAENIISGKIDKACDALGFMAKPVPRAILSRPKEERFSCSYSNFCGSYGCATDAKGSSRVALLPGAIATGNCTVIPNAKVFNLETDDNYRVMRAWYHDKENQKQSIEADHFVVAAQAVETARLLLMSKGKKYPYGLANNNWQLGKNLIFSGGGSGSGQFFYDELPDDEAAKLAAIGLFVNRSIQHWYEIEDESFGGKAKGGTIDFLWEHANAMGKLIRNKWDGDRLIYGSELKVKLHDYFTKLRKLRFEVFNDWLPTDDCFVALDEKVKDKWNDPVARIRLGYHPHDLKVGRFLARKATNVLEEMGAENISMGVSGSPPSNLMAGGCRFGNDPETSVLDKNCRAHQVDNLYVTDGSFMPTGGSVPYTWTIYANAFRVAEILKQS